MEKQFIEVTNRERNWGKFLLLRFDEEWEYQSTMSPGPLLRQVGWNPNQIWILDLQTSEGTALSPNGLASYDLDKHQIWVCPMYEPFLNWLYQQEFERLEDLPSKLDLPDAEFEYRGYRRGGDKVEVPLLWLQMLLQHARQLEDDMKEMAAECHPDYPWPSDIGNIITYLEDRIVAHTGEEP